MNSASPLENSGSDRLGPTDAVREPASDGHPPAEDPAALRREMNALVGMLSHDLRTPLSAISGWLHLLETGKLDAAGQQRALARIRSNIEGQVLLLDDAVLLARARSGSLQPALQTTAVGDVLGEASQSVTTLAAQKDIRIRLRAPGDALYIRGDGALLRRALAVALQHAVESTAQAGTVEVNVQTAGPEVCIAITEGNRRTKQELDALNDALRSGGSPFADGLTRIPRGLLLVQSLVAVHHGHIVATSQGPDDGATIAIYLPLDSRG